MGFSFLGLRADEVFESKESYPLSVAEEEALEAAWQRELEQAHQLAEAQKLRLELQQRSASKLRKLIGGLAVVALIAGVSCIAALGFNKKANSLAVVAQENALQAEREREVAQQSAAEAQRERTRAIAARDSAVRAEAEMQEIALQAEKERNHAQRKSYQATIRLAESMLTGDDKARYQVADMLWKTQAELRGWEWGHLLARCPLEEWSFTADPSGLSTLDTSSD